MFDVVTSADSVRINPVGRSRVAAPPLAMGIVRLADLLAAHHDAVQRLAEIPGLGVDSAQQIIAEVGATAATFPSWSRPHDGFKPRAAWPVSGSNGEELCSWTICQEPPRRCKPSVVRNHMSILFPDCVPVT